MTKTDPTVAEMSRVAESVCFASQLAAYTLAGLECVEPFDRGHQAIRVFEEVGATAEHFSRIPHGSIAKKAAQAVMFVQALQTLSEMMHETFASDAERGQLAMAGKCMEEAARHIHEIVFNGAHRHEALESVQDLLDDGDFEDPDVYEWHPELTEEQLAELMLQ